MPAATCPPPATAAAARVYRPRRPAATLLHELLRTLVDESLPEGSHEAVWDGRDASGREVSSGTFLARLEFGGRVEMRRMSLLR